MLVHEKAVNNNNENKLEDHNMDTNSLNEMVAHHTKLAIQIAETMGHTLDFSSESIHRVEDILDNYANDYASHDDMIKPLDREVWSIAAIWGIYVGEIMRIELGEECRWEEVDGGYLLNAHGAQANPIGKAYKRIVNGSEDNIVSFYDIIGRKCASISKKDRGSSGEENDMGYHIQDKLVVAVASSALFDLTESDAVFQEHGEEEYRKYQRENEKRVLDKGVAFPLIKRLLGLNDADIGDQAVEVVLLSRNDPDTGLRVFKSIEYYGLPITRAVFVTGNDPFVYMDAFNASLFLSGNKDDVKQAVELGLPAGCVYPTDFVDDEEDEELRIAFDFDGIMQMIRQRLYMKREQLSCFISMSG